MAPGMFSTLVSRSIEGAGLDLPACVRAIEIEELRRGYGRRRLANQDPERLTDVTIATCTAWNRFLDASAQ